MSKVLHLRGAAVALTAVLALTVAPGAVVFAQEDAGEQEKKRHPSVPEVNAQAWALADAESGQYLNGQHPDKRLPIASTTKIMIALITLEESSSLEEKVVISKEAESFVGSNYSNVGLIQNERVTVEDLLTATMLSSGNDAAYALAEHLGGGSVEQFVGRMNEKAEQLGLQNTNFENPVGLNQTNHYSSARDTTKITSEALEYERFRELVSQPEATITARGITERKIKAVNTNKLLTSRSILSSPQVTGVKSGISMDGFSLVSSAENKSESYITVVLNAPSSQERFSASEELLQYGFDTFEKRVLVEKGEVYGETNSPSGPVGLLAAENIHGTVVEGANVQKRFSDSANPSKDGEVEAIIDSDLPSFAEEGKEVSEVEVLVGGKSVGTSPLLAAESYDRRSLWNKVRHGIASLFQ